MLKWWPLVSTKTITARTWTECLYLPLTKVLWLLTLTSEIVCVSLGIASKFRWWIRSVFPFLRRLAGQKVRGSIPLSLLDWVPTIECQCVPLCVHWSCSFTLSHSHNYLHCTYPKCWHTHYVQAHYTTPMHYTCTLGNMCIRTYVRTLKTTNLCIPECTQPQLATHSSQPLSPWLWWSYSSSLVWLYWHLL